MLIRINWLLESVSLCPKVIPLSVSQFFFKNSQYLRWAWENLSALVKKFKKILMFSLHWQEHFQNLIIHVGGICVCIYLKVLNGGVSHNSSMWNSSDVVATGTKFFMFVFLNFDWRQDPRVKTTLQRMATIWGIIIVVRQACYIVVTDVRLHIMSTYPNLT
jgi:hypothetical protein